MDEASCSRKIRWKVPCNCSYKCAFFPGGICMIPESTRRIHMKKSRVGAVHPSYAITSEIPVSNESDIHETENHGANITKKSEKICCKCAACGINGSWISSRTFRRHNRIQGWRRTPSFNTVVTVQEIEYPSVVPLVSVENNFTENEERVSNVNEETATFTVSETNILQSILNDERTAIQLDEAILDKVILLFGLLDEHKGSQNLQVGILKILFGDLKKTLPQLLPDSDRLFIDRLAPLNYKSLSLARLLTLAGPDWMGGVDLECAPSSWNRLMETYQQHGMISPESWYMCTGNTMNPHSPTLIGPLDSNLVCQHPGCEILRSDMLKFYFISIISILKSLFRSKTICHDLLNFWRHRSEWIGKDENDEPERIFEFWHGSKIRRLQDFWDPSKTWDLPVICTNPECQRSYRAWPSMCDELLNPLNYNFELSMYNFPCVECSTEIKQRIESVKGEPFNIAILGHWDGFQAATTVQKDCWTVELTILNGGKTLFSESLLGKPIPVLFIPMSSSIIQRQKKEHILEAFLQPLYLDLQKLYITGFDVVYNLGREEVSEKSRGEKFTVRGMLLNWTGDHPAQCKIGGVLYKGYNGCRRDFLQSQRNQVGQIIYPNNRFQARFPACKRDIKSMNLYGKLLESAISKEEIEIYKARSGLSYKSKQWCLYDLYEFNISTDNVYDTMHSFILNAVKSYNDSFVSHLTSSQRKIFVSVLAKVTESRPSDLGSRWPRVPTLIVDKKNGRTNVCFKLSFYKAEEHLLFTMYCLSPILEVLKYDIDTHYGKVGAILIHLCRVFFLVSRKVGWTREMLHNARKHCTAWRILTEEKNGANSRILEHVLGNGEILDDILRHGHHDLFWCYSFERQVSGYNAIPTNNKVSEVTYTKYFCRYFFGINYAQEQVDRDGYDRFQRIIQSFENSLYPRIESANCRATCSCGTWYIQKIILVSSIQKATELYKSYCYIDDSYRCKPCVIVIRKGIAIGPKQPIETDLSVSHQYSEYLIQFWSNKGILSEHNKHEFRHKIQYIRGVHVNGNSFKKNDHAIVRHDSSVETWKCKILPFFIHEFAGHFEIFFVATWFTQVSNEERTGLDIKDVTGMNVLVKKPRIFRGDNVRSVTSLLHRFFPQPTVQKQNGKLCIVAFELDDLDSSARTHLLQPGSPGCYPPWIVEGDVVLAKATNWIKNMPFSLAYVHWIQNESDSESSLYEDRKISISWLQPDNDVNLQFASFNIFSELSCANILSVVDTSVLNLLEEETDRKVWRASSIDWLAKLHLTSKTFCCASIEGVLDLSE